ncbi:MAG: DUF1934 domain-containing protein [Firmicutes bacterium]|jgi:uncharacterized beta-barrel protein YwiB (DUF1934 family)|nr:DUF1934 domain-containing protein [Bacillota bacterium]
MKEITLKITGKQKIKGVEEDQMEFVTDGKLYERNNSIYIMYEESEVSGMKGCTTTIKMTDDSIKMRRNGDLGMNTELYFETGKRFNSIYNTPYGPMGIEVLTKYVDNRFDKETDKGVIDVEYKISMDGVVESQNRLTIEVM